ncbi:MAG: ABC transporter ATP-binding protein [Bacteroidia bacterium]|nr:ABC transporter ATP-binding protein [Bacteroidia bacterium]
MIEIIDLSKKYRHTQVLHHINLKFETGMVAGLIGPNGTGKTTLIKCILGLTHFLEGAILVQGKSISKQSGYRNLIGYMPQTGNYPENMKVSQLFAMIREIRSNQTTIDDDLLYRFGLENSLNKYMGQLSGGTVQKVSAVLAFMFDPPILILDEPTAGLDPLAAEILKEKISKSAQNKLVIITSHVLNDLDELASHIVFLQEGKLAFFEEITVLKNKYREQKLGKVITQIMGVKEKKQHA